LSYDRNGKVLEKNGRVVSLHLGVLPEGVTEQRKINILEPVNAALPIARVRIIVRSKANAKIGADNLFLMERNQSKDPATGIKGH
jgi:hypothetical protein